MRLLTRTLLATMLFLAAPLPQPSLAESVAANTRGIAAASLPAVIERVRASIVMIEAVGAGGRVTRGAGFIANAKGEIATAFHVVARAATIRLVTAEGRRMAAQVSSSDEPFDLALLAPAAPLGAPPLPIEAREPAPGVAVAAVGYPFGHAFSLSAGVVSGGDRSYDPMSPHGFLQHDAALNPGNSGGPLLDMQGRVVGVNAAIANGRRSDVGVSFAIPAAVVARVLEALARDGRIAHGRLGARLRLIDDALAAGLRRAPGGAAVEEIERDGAAHRAGLRAGDIVLAIGGQEIDSLRRVSQAVVGAAPGETVRLDVLRGGEKLAVDVRLDAARADDAAMPVSTAPAPKSLGVQFAARGGAVIAAVAPRSPAETAGLRKGDVVLAVGEGAAADAADARARLDAVTAPDIALLVRREGVGARYVVVSRSGESLGRSPLEGNREPDGSAAF